MIRVSETRFSPARTLLNVAAARRVFRRGEVTSPLNLIVLTLYFALALALTYPLALHLGTHIPGHDTDGPAQTWSLWWVPFALFNRNVLPFTTDYLFYPLGMNLVAYTPTFLNGILSIPLQFIFGTIAAQNVMVWLSLVAGAYGAFLLAREVLARAESRETPSVLVSQSETKTLGVLAAVLAGAVYGFGAWHLNYVVAGHFMLISNEWIPFYTLFLIRSDKSLKNAALAGLFLVLTVWTELTFVPFLALLTAFYVVYRVVVALPLTPNPSPIGRGGQDASSDSFPSGKKEYVHLLLGLGVIGALGLVGIAPLAWNLIADFQRYGYYLTSGVGRIQIFSAELISFFLPSAQHPFLGAWAESITTANTSYAFIGWAVLILAALGVFVARRWSFARFWAVAALLFALLMLGTTLIVANQNTNIPMPFALLRAIPFVNANRYPVRFNVMLMLSLVPLIALGSAYMLRRAQARRATTQERVTTQGRPYGVGGRVALVGLVVLLIAEQLVIPIPLTDVSVPPIFQQIKTEPGDFTVLELPLGWRGSVAMQGKTDDVAQFYQTVDQKRRLGGITSRVPAFKLQYYLETPVIQSLIALEEGRGVDDAQRARDLDAAAEMAHFFDIRYLSVNRAETDPAVLQYARDMWSLKEIASDETRTVYRVGLPPVTRGEIDAGSEIANMYFDDRWGRAQEDNAGIGARWSSSANAHLWLPLADHDYTLTFKLRGARDAPRVGLRVNDQTVTEWTISDRWGEYAAPVPRSILRDGLDDIVLVADTVALENAAPDDRIVGATGVTAPVDISATGAGFEAGKFGEIYVAGRSVVPNTRGYQLAAINAQTGQVERVGSFDTFADTDASARLANFVAQLPPGEIVAGVAIDDASHALTDAAVNALGTLGVSEDVRGQFRAGHAFIGVKGALPGQAVQDVNTRLPANVVVGKNVRAPQVSLAVAGIRFDETNK